VAGWLTILISGASGGVVTLLGVVAGGLIAGRSQLRQWTRDKQLDACAQLVQESTRMQLALLQHWRGGAAADWTAWNQALAMIWLVGTPAVRTEAKRMDRLFWLCGAQIKGGQMTRKEDWASARDEMEVARRDFINATRRDVVDAKTPVEDVPVARPPLSEIHQLFGPASVRRATESSGQSEPIDET
jgi:hypothetical protein